MMKSIHNVDDILPQIDDAHWTLCVCVCVISFLVKRLQPVFLFFFVRIITHQAFKTKIMKRRESKKQVSVSGLPNDDSLFLERGQGE